ncbi:MAG: hypothetical protein MPW15_18785 [Candidatus Manganitrophus sp.]|nr:hypothetical protein [Candidatus Manganitrophus sp.]
MEENLQALEKVAKRCKGLTAIVGFVDREEDIYNAAAVIHDGAVRFVYHKCHLPNYGVFDENRYFQAGKEAPVFTLNGMTLGVNICEDIWYPEGPTFAQALGGGSRGDYQHQCLSVSCGKRTFPRRDDRDPRAG